MQVNSNLSSSIQHLSTRKVHHTILSARKQRHPILRRHRRRRPLLRHQHQLKSEAWTARSYQRLTRVLVGHMACRRRTRLARKRREWTEPWSRSAVRSAGESPQLLRLLLTVTFTRTRTTGPINWWTWTDVRVPSVGWLSIEELPFASSLVCLFVCL